MLTGSRAHTQSFKLNSWPVPFYIRTFFFSFFNTCPIQFKFSLLLLLLVNILWSEIQSDLFPSTMAQTKESSPSRRLGVTVRNHPLTFWVTDLLKSDVHPVLQPRPVPSLWNRRVDSPTSGCLTISLKTLATRRTVERKDNRAKHWASPCLLVSYLEL